MRVRECHVQVAGFNQRVDVGGQCRSVNKYVHAFVAGDGVAPRACRNNVREPTAHNVVVARATFQFEQFGGRCPQDLIDADLGGVGNEAGNQSIRAAGTINGDLVARNTLSWIVGAIQSRRMTRTVGTTVRIPSVTVATPGVVVVPVRLLLITICVKSVAAGRNTVTSNTPGLLATTPTVIWPLH